METSLRSIIAKRIKTKGLSQADLARRAGVRPQRLCDWLKGRRALRQDTVERLLAAAWPKKA